MTSTSADGGTVKVPLMHEQMHVGYMETEEFQLADLPYKGEVLSMTVLLPRQAGGLEALEKKLSAADLGRVDRQGHSCTRVE